MKTLFKTYTDHKKITAKRIEFEVKTGLKWQSYNTGDGQRFVPIATKDTPLNTIHASTLFEFLTTEYKGFVSLAEESGMDLQDVISGAYTLVKKGDAIPTVCRMGGLYAIRLKAEMGINYVK